MDFTHLHLHSTYSMLDGAIKIKELVNRVKEMGMSSVAITDHGNLFGTIEFYKEANKAGVKPIIGSEFYVSNNRKKEEDKDGEILDGGNYHLILLAKDEIGYKNIIKLSSMSYTEGFYKKPRIDYDLLGDHSEGLVCLTACLAGEVNKHFLSGNDDKAIALANRLHEIFRKEDFYLEIQNHGIPEQEIVAKKVIEFSKKTGIPTALTNDSHFLNKDDQQAQDLLLRIAMNKSIDDEMRFAFNPQFYVKSPLEMSKLFPEHMEAFHNTKLISDKVNLSFQFGNPLLPKFDVPQGYDSDSFMEKLVWDGLKERYAFPFSPDVEERAKFELGVITKMQFSGYFLIVQDYINFAKRRGIPVGPGRGSAAGSIVAYALGITNVDPIRYNLLFERFLNPDRMDMPDIDTDFSQDRREEVINYLKEKYGDSKVSQIISYSSLAAKAAVKDVARVFQLPFTESLEITKAFPKALGLDLKEALENSKELQALADKNEVTKKIFALASKIEGNFRQTGRHAAGVVIGSTDLDSIVPMATVNEKSGGKESKRVLVTQYDKDQIESVGLIKMDLLGLKNLTTIQMAIETIQKRHGIDLDIDKLPLDDEKTFTLLRKANVLGVFQLDSSTGIRDLFAKAQVKNFEEIAALLALYRPGPMGSGMLDDYIDRKNGKKQVSFPKPALKDVLQETYGVVVYQEQVMAISRIIGNFTVGESDVLRKAMAKKDKTKLPALKEKFVKGANELQYDKKFATELFEQLEKFGEYGFNKSHSVAYAFITYQTAYLKANYTTEYFTALLATENGKVEDLVKYINNAKEMGIKILGPDVNLSEVSFSVSEDKTIRFGLSSIKGVGEIAGNAILEYRKKLGRPFEDLTEFLISLDTSTINKRVLEALVSSGAFDSFGYSRLTLYSSIDLLINFSNKEQEEKRHGQFSLFSSDTVPKPGLPLPIHANEWGSDFLLQKEKESTGLYFSGHPLDKFSKLLAKLPGLSIEKLEDVKTKTDVEIAGIITERTIKQTKRKEDFANFLLGDKTGDIECVAFPKTFARFKDFLIVNQPIIVKGILERIEDGESEVRGQIIVNHVEALTREKLEVRQERSLHIIFPEKKPSDDVVPKLQNLFRENKGNCEVFFHLKDSSGEKRVIKAHDHFTIEPKPEILNIIRELLGENSVKLMIGNELKAI